MTVREATGMGTEISPPAPTGMMERNLRRAEDMCLWRGRKDLITSCQAVDIHDEACRRAENGFMNHLHVVLIAMAFSNAGRINPFA